MIPFTRDTLILSTSAPGKPYRPRLESEKLSVHWGQRKLLLSEIAFLTQATSQQALPNPIVVYAGAAPGLHLPFLSSLFPTMTFHLYDPAPFGLTATSQLHLYQRKFNHDDAQNWARHSEVLFISDIRTADHLAMTPDQNEINIIEDLRIQETWYHLMHPVSALLKFRLPYPSTKTAPTFRYLDGTIMKQIWAPQMTTETRLIPNGQIRDYDLVTYESQMFYHNTEIRESATFQNPFTLTDRPIDPPELINDFDSVAETWILQEYLKSRGRTPDSVTVIQLSRRITREMSNQHVTLVSLRNSEIKSTTKQAARKYSNRGAPRNRSIPFSSRDPD